MTRVYNQTKNRERRRTLRNSMTPAEVRLWVRLKERETVGAKFRRQYGVGPYILDFYCPSLKLAIEVDGESHFLDGEPEKDRFRQAYIERYGIWFLRFTNREVMDNPEGVFEAILRFIDAERPHGVQPSESG